MDLGQRGVGRAGRSGGRGNYGLYVMYERHIDDDDDDDIQIPSVPLLKKKNVTSTNSDTRTTCKNMCHQSG